jgi:trimethylamine--corrinoid protein Co-methyltransferase
MLKNPEKIKETNMTRQINVETLHPQTRMLSDEQIQAIHHSTLDILSQTGIVLKNKRAEELLLEAGAHKLGERIKIPARLVQNALLAAPSRIPMHTRTGVLSMPLESGKVFFGTGSDCNFTIDLESGERRPVRLKDVQDIARLCDGLDNIDFVMSMGVSSDVSPMHHYIHGIVAMLRGSIKPMVFTANGLQDMQTIYEIACAVAGGPENLLEKPFLLHYAEPISPLLFSEESVDKLLFCAEKGIPAGYIPSPNTGGGGPITLAGALALGNAETLAGLALTQLVRPGTPYIYGMNTATLDMKSTIVSYGAPEWPTGMMAWTDMGRWYKLPVWGVSGATDSKSVDAQAGIEATVSIMSAFLSRCNLNHDVGYIEYGSTSSMEMVVMADEIIGEVRFIMDGVEVSERTLAREAIHAAKPGSGFLAAEHTLSNWKWAQWKPKLIDRSRYDEWQRGGSKDLSQRANLRARKILAEHQTEPLPEAVEREIQKILDGLK